MELMVLEEKREFLRFENRNAARLKVAASPHPILLTFKQLRPDSQINYHNRNKDHKYPSNNNFQSFLNKLK